MATIRELKEQRAVIFEQQKDVHSRATEENRSMNEEENTQWDKWEEEYSELSKRIEKMEEMERKEKEAAMKSGTDLSKEAKRTMSADPVEREEQRLNAFRRWATNNYTQEDIRLLNQFEDRAQSTTTTAGGFTIPEGFSKKLEIQREFYGPVRSACTVWKTEKGDQIPYPTVDDTGNDGQTESEGGDLTASTTDVTFSEKTLNAYKVHSDMLKVSNELLNDSYFDFEGVMADLLGERVARKENSLFTTGSGSSTPNGVVTAAQQASRIASTTTVTRAEILDLVHSVNPYYRQSPSAAFMFNDTTLKVIKKLAVGTSDDRPLWEPSMVAGAPDQIEGHPYYINQDVANLAASGKFMLFGDWSKFIVRDSGPARFVKLYERFADTDQAAFALIVRVDSELLIASAIKYLIGATS